MADNPIDKDNLNYILHQLNDPEAGNCEFTEYDWRSKVLPKMMEGDINGMKQAAAPFVQYETIKTALTAKNESTRLTAQMFVLGQGGHGVIQKHNVVMEYDKLPTDQLTAMISSKIALLAKLNPHFDPARLLTQAKTATRNLNDDDIIEVEPD